MSDVIETKVEDLYLEHSQHNNYEEKCSTCYNNVREFDGLNDNDEISIEEWEQCKQDKLLEEAESASRDELTNEEE